MPDTAAKASAETSRPGEQVTAVVGELPKKPSLPLLGPNLEFNADTLRAYARGFVFGLVVGSAASTLALLLSLMFGIIYAKYW